MGGISVENSSISASARSTAFMPLVHSRLPQNTQFTWVTHLFLKLALDVDMAVDDEPPRQLSNLDGFVLTLASRSLRAVIDRMQ